VGRASRASSLGFVGDLELRKFDLVVDAHAPVQHRSCVHRLRVGWLNGFSFITSTGAFHSSHPQGQLSGRGTTRAENAQGTPTQSHISPSILVYGDYRFWFRV